MQILIQFPWCSCQFSLQTSFSLWIVGVTCWLWLGGVFLPCYEALGSLYSRQKWSFQCTVSCWIHYFVLVRVIHFGFYASTHLYRQKRQYAIWWWCLWFCRWFCNSVCDNPHISGMAEARDFRFCMHIYDLGPPDNAFPHVTPLRNQGIYFFMPMPAATQTPPVPEQTLPI